MTAETETQKQIETTTAELLDMERQLQAHERILDQLWETVHPGQEQDDDAEPEELARQICEAWAELGRKQLERDDQVAAAVGHVADNLSDIQRAARLSEQAQDEANTLALLGHEPLPFGAVAELVKRWEDRHDQEGSPSVQAEIARCARELTAVTIRHMAGAPAGLLGGTALVEPAAAEPLNGEVPACAAPCLRGPDGPSAREGACMLPVGHDDDHLDRSLRNKTPEHAHEVIVDATFGCLAPSATDDFILALRPKVAAWLQRIDEELLVRCRRAEPVAGCSCGAQFATTDDALDHECPLHQPLNPGETPECGVVLPHDGGARSRFRCARPAGHEGHHLSAQGDTWGAP